MAAVPADIKYIYPYALLFTVKNYISGELISDFCGRKRLFVFYTERSEKLYTLKRLILVSRAAGAPSLFQTLSGSSD